MVRANVCFDRHEAQQSKHVERIVGVCYVVLVQLDASTGFLLGCEHPGRLTLRLPCRQLRTLPFSCSHTFATTVTITITTSPFLCSLNPFWRCTVNDTR